MQLSSPPIAKNYEEYVNLAVELAENKKNWKPDDTLTKLFSLDASKTYTFMNINGLLTRVIDK